MRAGLARLIRMGWFPPVHAKSMEVAGGTRRCWLRASSFLGDLSTWS